MNANTMMQNFKIADSDWAAINQTPKAKAKMEACIKVLLSAIDLSGKTGLDFGCGEGAFAKRLRDMGARVIGCDISDYLVPKDDPDLWVGSAESLDRVPSDSLDFMIAMQVTALMPKEDQDRLFHEAYRMLKPGAPLLILTGNSHMTPAKKNPSDPLTFKNRLQAYGFEETTQYFYNCLRPFPARLFNGSITFDLPTCEAMPMKHRQKKCTAYISLSLRS